MSWISKVTGMDKRRNKKFRDAINQLLRLQFDPEMKKLQERFYDRAEDLGVDRIQSGRAWIALMRALKVSTD